MQTQMSFSQKNVRRFRFEIFYHLKLCILDWNNVTREEALDPSAHPIFVYSASKALAEKEIWKFAEAHPDINVTTRQSLSELPKVDF